MEQFRIILLEVSTQCSRLRSLVSTKNFTFEFGHRSYHHLMRFCPFEEFFCFLFSHVSRRCACAETENSLHLDASTERVFYSFLPFPWMLSTFDLYDLQWEENKIVHSSVNTNEAVLFKTLEQIPTNLWTLGDFLSELCLSRQTCFKSAHQVSLNRLQKTISKELWVHNLVQAHYLCERWSCPHFFQVKRIQFQDFLEPLFPGCIADVGVVHFENLFFKIWMEGRLYVTDSCFQINHINASKEISEFFRDWSCCFMAVGIGCFKRGCNFLKSCRYSSMNRSALTFSQWLYCHSGWNLQLWIHQFCFIFMVTIYCIVQTVSSWGQGDIEDLFRACRFTIGEGSPCSCQKVCSIQSTEVWLRRVTRNFIWSSSHDGVMEPPKNKAFLIWSFDLFSNTWKDMWKSF